MSTRVRRPNVFASSLSVPYQSVGFPPSHRIGSGHLNFSWGDLLWAAITIGRPNTAYVFRHGDASFHEAIFRISLIRMALEQIPFSPYLHRTDAFGALDPTEKGAISYFLGMAVCKLFASELLNTPWLLHLDVFRDQLNPATLRGRSRPDLIGQDPNGAWHAFETKGRSSVPSTEDKMKAKAQAQRLVSVNGSACSLHIGSFAYFRQNGLEFYWRDPEPEEPEKLEPIAISVGEQDWANYYEPALALDFEVGSELLSAQTREIDLTVEIHPKVREPLLESRWVEARLLVTELRQVLAEEGFQPDGLRVVAGDSWQRRRDGTEG